MRAHPQSNSVPAPQISSRAVTVKPSPCIPEFHGLKGLVAAGEVVSR